MPETRNWAAMLEEQAANRGDHPFLYLIDQDQYISYNEMDKNANRIGNYLLANGGGPGKGIATLMENSSQFLDIFFGIQKIGMYINPVNTELRGEGSFTLLTIVTLSFWLSIPTYLICIRRSKITCPR